jgi:hypothetical protein
MNATAARGSEQLYFLELVPSAFDGYNVPHDVFHDVTW